MAVKKIPPKRTEKTESKSAPKANKRRYVRFKPDPGTLALILKDQLGNKVSPPIPCLVIEEAHGGCSILCTENEGLKKGSVIQIQVGHLAPMMAQIRWLKKYESKFFSAGLIYLE